MALPPIAFVTAFDQHAVEAFRWAACDYLLKPLDRDRLRDTLGRVSSGPAAPDLNQLLEALQSAQRHQVPERFTVQVKGRLRVLAWAEVSHLRTENRLLLVHTPEGHFVLDRTLDELEAALTPRFIRVHRGAMVALDQIRELLPEPGGTGELRLADGSRLPVSRDRMPDLRRRLA
ncbi:MAG: response regulator transcription factor [Holophagaceae bacterium]|nr:response regulator transcription factor [Holophagaceae bacterium]